MIIFNEEERLKLLALLKRKYGGPQGYAERFNVKFRKISYALYGTKPPYSPRTNHFLNQIWENAERDRPPIKEYIVECARGYIFRHFRSVRDFAKAHNLSDNDYLSLNAYLSGRRKAMPESTKELIKQIPEISAYLNS